MKEESLAPSARLVHLVRGALAVFATDHEAARKCLIADQSHLNRVFRRVVGVSPGVWRRYVERANPEGE